jgi:DNA polymerase-1
LTAGATHRPVKKGDHLYLVDGSGYLFRAYHALPPLSRKSDGLPTNAVSGFSNMLWKLLEDMKAGDKPSHLAVIFDAGKKTFRNDIYPLYKANRPIRPKTSFRNSRWSARRRAPSAFPASKNPASKPTI